MYGGYRGSGNALNYDESAALGILHHLDKTELQGLLDDERKMKELIDDVPQVKNIELEKETLLASNKSLADFNLSKEPRLSQARMQLASTYEQSVKVQKEFDKNKQKIDFSSSQQSTDTTLALLQTEAAKSEEASEVIAEDFLDGKLEVEDFISKYLDTRKESHLRKVKAEKMAELLSARQTSPHYRTPVPPPKRAPPYPAPAASSPYPPLGGVQFAMPSPASYLPR